MWWQGNRPALFRLVSAIMKKHHQLRREAQCSVYRDTQQIITIDCYLGTRKKRQWKKEQRKMDRESKDGDHASISLFASFTNYILEVKLNCFYN